MKTAVFAIFFICCVHITYQFVLSKNNEAAFLKRQLRQAPAVQSDSTSVEDLNNISVESASNEINQANKNRPRRAVPVVSDESVAFPEVVSIETDKDPVSIESPETSAENKKSGRKV